MTDEDWFRQQAAASREVAAGRAERATSKLLRDMAAVEIARAERYERAADLLARLDAERARADAAEAREREAVVRWLQSEAASRVFNTHRGYMEDGATAIERGDHRGE